MSIRLTLLCSLICATHAQMWVVNFHNSGCGGCDTESVTIDEESNAAEGLQQQQSRLASTTERNSDDACGSRPPFPFFSFELEAGGEDFIEAMQGFPQGLIPAAFQNGRGHMKVHNDDNGSTELQYHFRGLLPRSLYTLHDIQTEFDSENPATFQARPVGSENAIWTDENGRACGSVSWEEELTVGVLLTYHSEGRVAGAPMFRGALATYLPTEEDRQLITNEQDAKRAKSAHRGRGRAHKTGIQMNHMDDMINQQIREGDWSAANPAQLKEDMGFWRDTE